MTMWNKLARFILRNRLLLIGVIALLTGYMAFQAYQVKLSYEFARVLPEQDSSYQAYVKFKQKFGEDGSVMVIGFSDPNLFTLKKFNEWYDLNQEIRQMDGIEEVVSMARIYNLQRNDSMMRFDLTKVVQHKPGTQAELDSIKKIIYALPFYNGLIINKKTNTTLMAVTFDKKKLNTKNRIAIVHDIKNKAKLFGQRNHIPIHISGLPYIRTAITEKVSNEMILFLVLAIIVTGFILWIFFRSFQVVFFSIVVVAIGVVWSVGTISLLGYTITMLTGLIPPLIIVIGVPNSIFLLNKYQQEIKKHQNKIKALARTIEKVGVTTFLANLTTSIGFGVFYFTKSAILVEFGQVAAINVMATYAISLIFIPVVFSYLPAPSVKQTKHLKNKIIHYILDKIDFWVHHHRKIIYGTLAAILLISLLGITQIKPLGYVVDDLPKTDPIYADMKFFEQHFKGVLPFEVTIDAGKPGGALTLGTLGKINAAQKIFSTYPEFSKPISIVEALKFSNQAYGKKYVFPDAIRLSELAAYTGAEKAKTKMFKSFLDSSRQQTRISVQMADAGTIRSAEIINELKPKMDSVFNSGEQKYKINFTGNSLIFLKGNSYLIRNLAESVFFAIFLISIIMILLFMSARMILLSILPSLIPLVITAGLMGFFDIHLKPSTILIFSIAFGIASDGTIYFLTKYRQELKHHNWSISKTVSLTIKETGVSMIYTAIILFFGFGIFAASDFGGTAALGILISITLLIGMCSNLILLPALLISLEKKLTTKAFLQDSLIEIYDEEEDIQLENLTIKKDNKTITE